ncbi:MAG TPA: DUF4388 domain-containing protein [Ktedonobacteraceae bacterium]|nr:DUF4388 domain-containing protein [Ktedonobacteraceae bacterium]
MSLIGSLEQFDLANILRRIEVFAKTGLFVVKQQDTWAEFYFRQGQLVCIGPMHTNVTLLDRLLQANLLSYQAVPQIRSVISAVESNETRIALALIEEGYLSREILRAWAAHETSQVLQKIFTWSTGELYFEEDCSTPADRLLVALSISALLDAMPVSNASTPAPRSAGVRAPDTDELVSKRSPLTSTQPMVLNNGNIGQFNAAQLIETELPFASPTPEQVPPTFAGAPATHNPEVSGTLSASQLLGDLSFGTPGSQSSPSSNAPDPQTTPTGSLFGAELDISASTQSTLIPPQPVANPLPPARIDTSFMTPDLVLVPVDLSSLRERNPQVQLTPDQWRLFSLVDGQVSLQGLCSLLMASAEQVRMVAGELMAIGLVMPLTQNTGSFNEFVPSAQPVMNTNQFSPASYASAAPTWMPSQPTSLPPAPFAAPIETQSQWGNGNTGMTFMMGGGWVLSSKQAASQSGQPNMAYAPVGSYR